MEDKYYFLSVDKWNLMESLVTESISPFTFYWKRNFSNSLSRIKDEGNKKYSQLLLCSVKKGSECLIGIHESLLDKSSFNKIVKKDKKGFYQEYFSYNKTIYFKRGLVKFLFRSVEDINSIISESKIVFELKCVEKYREFFYVDKYINDFPANVKPFSSEPSTFEENINVEFDNNYNLIKGSIIGYVRGLLTSCSSDHQKLKATVIKLKNDFTGLHTDIMVNNIRITKSKFYESEIKLCQRLYSEQRSENTNYFGMLLQIFSQLKMLASKRALELLKMRGYNYVAMLYEKKNILINEMNAIEFENNLDGIKSELEQIKVAEVHKGKFVGKSRVYFKKGTKERRRKDYLKSVVENFGSQNSEYIELQKQLKNINKKIVSKETNVTEYDNTIASLFNRISDIMNDILKEIEQFQILSSVNLSQLDISDGNICLKNDVKDIEIEYFNITLNYILTSNVIKPISDNTIMDLIIASGQQFSKREEAKSETGVKILKTLRDFWKYKNNKILSFTLPDDMLVFNSIMSFYVKPFGFDQIERYMLNHNYSDKKYAFMLWGACKGYADLPKTFTNVLYENDISTQIDDFLFNSFLK